MTNEEIPIKILIPVEEELPLVAEKTRPDVKGAASKAGQQIARTAKQATKKVWQSNARKKVTGCVKRGATAVAAKGAQVMHDTVVKTAEKQAKERATAVQTRIKETDWKEASKAGVVNTLRWMSHKLGQLAERLTPEER